jgi:hypothetical protein
MVIGALGDIVFQVSRETVETLDGMVWSGSAQWATHNRHGGNALTEFTGLDPDSIKFDVYLSAYLGVSPMEEIGKIWAYERAGEAVPLTIGDHKYGRYRWGIQSHSVSVESTDGSGNLVSATVSLELIEYLKD